MSHFLHKNFLINMSYSNIIRETLMFFDESQVEVDAFLGIFGILI